MSNTDKMPVVEPAGSEAERLIEEWECRACNKTHPCVIQIHFEAGWVDRHVAQRRLLHRPQCLTGESHYPVWVEKPIRRLSPNPKPSGPVLVYDPETGDLSIETPNAQASDAKP